MFKDCENLFPDYLNFIKGVVDSKKLTENISREMLKENTILQEIRKHLIRKCLEFFFELSEDKQNYKEFYALYGKNIKLGVNADSKNRAKLVELMRFNTSASGDEYCSLTEYVERMKDNQRHIFYISGENKEELSHSAIVKNVTKRGLEVIYMTEPVDEYVIQHLKEFHGKELVCVTRETLKRKVKKSKFSFIC